jgi:hypothetical protein
MFKPGDRVRVTEKYPCHGMLRWHVGSICTVKLQKIEPDAIRGDVLITIDFDGGPCGRKGLIFYPDELELLS